MSAQDVRQIEDGTMNVWFSVVLVLEQEPIFDPPGTKSERGKDQKVKFLLPLAVALEILNRFSQ